MTRPLAVLSPMVCPQEGRTPFYSVDEELDHFLRSVARLAAGDPAVLAQGDLLAPQLKLGVALERDEGAVGAVVLEQPLALAPLDRAVAARGHVVADRDAAVGVAADVHRVVVAAARDLLAAVLQAQDRARGGRLQAAGRERRRVLVGAPPDHLAQDHFL